MKIPFTLKDWLKDKCQKVETRDGNHLIESISIDLTRDDMRVIANFGNGRIIHYYDNGRFWQNATSDIDLFIVTPEPELTEFEKALESFYNHHLQVCSYDNQGTVEDSLHYGANKLLTIAREELVRQGYVIEKKAFHDAVENISDKHWAEMSVEYSIHCKVEDGTRHAIMNWESFQKLAQKFIDIGKTEALKDLPRWEKYSHNAGEEPLVNGILQEDGSYKWRLYLNGYKIEISDLEKLPGFKED